MVFCFQKCSSDREKLLKFKIFGNMKPAGKVRQGTFSRLVTCSIQYFSSPKSKVRSIYVLSPLHMIKYQIPFQKFSATSSLNGSYLSGRQHFLALKRLSQIKVRSELSNGKCLISDFQSQLSMPKIRDGGNYFFLFYFILKNSE